MGGSSTSYKTTWRDSRVRVCTCMVDALDEGARLLTVRAKALGLRDHRVLGIPYFGSWQDGSTASGDIGAGGGHIDIDLTGYTDAERKLLEAIYREVGFYADIRLKRIYSPKLDKTFVFTWQTHLHMVMKDCPHRTSLAKSQVYQWQKNAADGLAATPDLDDGPRNFLYQTWEQYKARAAGQPVPSPVQPKTYVIKGGDTLGKIAAALGVTLAAVLIANPQIKNPDVIAPGQTITVPAKDATVAPAPAPAPAPKPVATPKPTTTKAPALPKPTSNPAPAVKLPASSAKQLRAGARNSTVKVYEKALAAYIGSSKARALGLTGTVVTDGYYGTATSAATKAAYRKLGVTPNATEPGPTLLKVLSGVKVSNPAPKATTARVDASKLHKGVSSRHVTAYQKALRAYVGSTVARRVNPAGATGFYGSQTQALTKAAYRKLGSTPNATEPGPYLLKVLGLR